MGACTSAKSNKKTFSLDSLPDDIELYSPSRNAHLQNLTFEGSLANVQIEGQFQKSYGLVFEISDGCLRIQLPRKQPKCSEKSIIKWKIQKSKFNLKLNEYELRSRFLTVSVLDESKKITDVKKINLFYLATGPIRNIFKMKGTETEQFFVFFDLRITQVIKAQIGIEKTQIELKSEYPGESFNFSFQLQLTNNGQNFRKLSSRPSEVFLVPITKQLEFQPIEEQPEDEEESPFILHLSVPSRENSAKSSNSGHSKLKKSVSLSATISTTTCSFLSWEKLLSGSLPYVKLHMTAEEINGSLFVFNCWKVSKIQRDNDDSQKEQNGKAVHFKDQMNKFASFKFTLYHLFNGLEENISLQSSVNKKRQSAEQIPQRKQKSDSSDSYKRVKLHEQLWYNGQVMGTVDSIIKIRLPKYLKQFQGCTRTDHGKLNLVINDYRQINTTDQSSSLKCFEALGELHSKLKEIKNRLADPEMDYFLQQRLYPEAVCLMEDINEEMGRSFAESHIVTESKTHGTSVNDNELREKQIILLQVAETVSGVLREEGKFDLVEQCWKFMTVFIKRGEFKLENIGFDVTDKRQLAEFFNKEICKADKCAHQGKEKYHESLKKRVKIALRFENLVFECLNLSLNSVPYSGTNGNTQREYCEKFKVECFFKIPLFRDRILECIHRENDCQIDEFHKSQQQDWSNPRSSFIKDKQNQMAQEFDWSLYFYKALSFHQDSIDRQEDLSRSIIFSVWIENISQRKSAFFQFLSLLFSQMEKIQSRLKLPKLTYLSGYNKLIIAFLSELKTLPLKKLSSSILKASIPLLGNEEICESIIKMISYKVNLHDSNAITKWISIMKGFIRGLTKEGTLLPLHFCYGTFTRMLKAILDTEMSYCLSGALLLVYDTYPSFESEYVQFLTSFFLGKIFLRLFYHWSHMVRYTFHHFFLLRISQNKNIFADKSTPLYKKYAKAIQQLENHLSKFQREKELKNQITSKEDNYHKKMRHKLWLKKQQEEKIKLSLKLSPIKSCKQQSDHKILVSEFNVSPKKISENSINVFNAIKSQQIIDQNLQNYPGSARIYFSKKPSERVDSEDSVFLSQIPLVKNYTYHEDDKYNGVFLEEEFSLENELTENQRKQLPISHREFSQINTKIREEFCQKKELPQIKITNLLSLDEDDIKPDNVDFFNF